MGKLLRVLVVLLLLLGIGALILGLQLFQKRETLKGHVQDIARQVFRLSETIEAEQVDDLTTTGLPKMNSQVSITQLLTYKPDPTLLIVDPSKPVTMDETMNLLYGKAAIQLNRLQDTRSALSQKIQEFDAATNTIATLEAVIARLEEEKKQLQEQVAALERDVADKKSKIDSLSASLEEAANTIDDQRNQIDTYKDELMDKNDQIKALEETIKKLEVKIGVSSDRPFDPASIESGTKGKLVLVNPDWNFTIVAIRDNTSVSVGLELLVQRGDKLIGKVRISDLNDQYQLAICDILLDWKQADLEVGDYVFY